MSRQTSPCLEHDTPTVETAMSCAPCHYALKCETYEAQLAAQDLIIAAQQGTLRELERDLRAFRRELSDVKRQLAWALIGKKGA